MTTFNIIEGNSTLEFETNYPKIRQDVVNGMLIKDVMAKHNLTQGKWIKYRKELIREGIIKKRTFKEAKFYYYRKDIGKYIVMKVVDGRKRFFGRYDSEKDAQKIVKELKKCNWDRNQLKEIQNKCIVNFTIREGDEGQYQKEIEEKFKQVVPYLEKGLGLYYAIEQVDGKRPSPSRRWFKDLKAYCWSEGYNTDKMVTYPYKKMGKYYYPTSHTKKRFAIYRTVDGERRYFGVVTGEGRAKAIVQELNKVSWDKSEFTRIRKEYVG